MWLAPVSGETQKKHYMDVQNYLLQEMHGEQMDGPKFESWWATRVEVEGDSARTRPFLFVNSSYRKDADKAEGQFVAEGILGYGMIYPQLDHFLLAGSLMPAHRAKGWGKVLFTQLCHEHDLICPGMPAYLEVTEENHRARRCYRALGFEEVFTVDGIVTMRRQP